MTQPFGPLEVSSHEIVLGMPRTGKTYRARQRLASVRRLVAFDPAGDWSGEGEEVSAADLAADPGLLRGRFRRLVVLPDGDVAEEFAAVVGACRSVPEFGGLVLVADEVGDYWRRAAQVLERIHRNGHHDGVASMLISQCAVDIPLTCRRTATRVESLLQTDPADLEALEERYGAEFRERAARWRPGEPAAVWVLPSFRYS